MSVDRRSELTTVLFLGGQPRPCQGASLRKLAWAAKIPATPPRRRQRPRALGRGLWRWRFASRGVVRARWRAVARPVRRVDSEKWKSRVIVLDARDGRLLATHSFPDHLMVHRFGAQTITLSGSRFAVMLNRSVVVCKLDGRAGDETESLASFAHESNIAGISLMADGSRLITLDQLGVVREWDLTPPPRMMHAF